jgi:hypothetical protein
MISNGGIGHEVTFVLDASSVENEGDVVDIAVTPVLARLGGADDGVADIAGMRGGVLARRVVAATDVPARVAHAQVDPPTAACEALLATSDAFG